MVVSYIIVHAHDASLDIKGQCNLSLSAPHHHKFHHAAS